MEQSHVERNAAELVHLRALVAHVRDEELSRDIDGAWTVSALLAHLAFWDRYAVARWAQARRNGQRVPLPTGKIADLVSDAAREGWLACPPRVAALQALAAAEASARLIAGLDARIRWLRLWRVEAPNSSIARAIGAATSTRSKGLSVA